MGLIREWRNSNPEGREWKSNTWCTAFETGALVIPHCLASFLSVYHNCVFVYGGKSGLSSSRSVTNTCKDPWKTFCARVFGVGGLCAGWRSVSVIPPSGTTLSLEHPHSLLSCRLNFCFEVGLISCVLGFWGFGLFVFVFLKWEILSYLCFKFLFEKRNNLRGGGISVQISWAWKKFQAAFKKLACTLSEVPVDLVCSNCRGKIVNEQINHQKALHHWSDLLLSKEPTENQHLLFLVPVLLVCSGLVFA